MNCKYSYNEENSQYLYCNISRQMCPMMKYCHKIEKYVSSDNYSTNCKYYQGKEEEDMNTNNKQGSLRVRLIKGKVLYVELGDINNQVIRVDNPYQFNPTYVDLIEVNEIYYVKGFEPKLPKKEKKDFITEVKEDGK